MPTLARRPCRGSQHNVRATLPTLRPLIFGVALLVSSLLALSRTDAQRAAIDTARVHRDLAILRGRVTRDADSAGIANADVWLITLNVHVAADSNGRFAIVGIPPGVQFVQVRHVGYEPVRLTILLRAGEDTAMRFGLKSLVAQLDTVRTIAPQHRYLSPNLRAFEERRLSGMGGHFISDSVLRANEGRTLANIIASRVPGATVAPGVRGSSVLISTRKQCRGPAMRMCTTPDCYAAVYLDGVEIFNPGMADQKSPQPPPDLSRIQASDLSGVEFYAGSAAAPVDMQSSRSEGCGTLWLWTRER